MRKKTVNMEKQIECDECGFIHDYDDFCPSDEVEASNLKFITDVVDLTKKTGKNQNAIRSIGNGIHETVRTYIKKD